MDTDDPADWSIDRVIKETCQLQLPAWAIGTSLKPIINPEAVAKAFKDNDIDGDNLLALENRDLQSDLGITSFGQRRGLSNVINHLRSKSLKYQEQMSRLGLNPLATPHMSHTSVGSYAQSPSLLGFRVPPIEHSDDGERPRVIDLDSSVQVPSSIPRKRQHEEVDQDMQASDSFVVVPLPVSGDAQSGASEAQPQQTTSDWVQNVSNPSTGPNESFLNALDSVIDQELNVDKDASNPGAADNSIDNTSSKKKKTPKRATLVPVTNVASAATLVQDEAFSRFDVPQPVAEIPDRAFHFIGGRNTIGLDGPSAKRLKLDQAPSPSTGRKVSALNARCSVSRRRYHRADQYQQSAIKRISNDNDPDNTSAASVFFICGSNARIPSLKHAARNVKPLSELNDCVVQQPEAQAIASIDEPKLVPDQTDDFQQVSVDQSNMDLPPALQSILARYPVHVDNTILPLYGESDDEDRWTLVSESSSLKPESDRDVLRREEIDQIIDACLEEYKADWNARHLVKTQVKAHKKWTIAAKNNFLHRGMLNDCKVLRDKFLKRISELRNGIHVNQWRKAEEVKQQCLAIQVTAHQLEEYNLYVIVLECEEEPGLPAQPAPSQRRRSRKHQVDENGEEELDSASDVSFIDVDDGIDQALVADPDVDDHENSMWNPRFAEGHSATNQQQHSNMITQDEDHDTVIDSIEDWSELQIHNEDVHTMSQKQQESRKTQTASKPTRKSASRRSDSRNENAADADFDRPARLPKTKHGKSGKSGKSKDKPIDLTDLSPTPGPIRASSVTSNLSIRTPRLTPIEPSLNLQHNTIASKPDLKVKAQSFKSKDVPLFLDVKRVMDMEWSDIEPHDEDQVPDSRLALAKSVYDLSKSNACLLLDYAKSFSTTDDFADVLHSGLEAVRQEDDDLIDVNQKNQAVAHLMTDCFISFTSGYCVDPDFECSEKMIDDAYAMLQQDVQKFRDLFCRLLEKLIAYRESNPINHYSLDSETESSLANDNTGDKATRKRRTGKKGLGMRVRLARNDDILWQQLRDRKRVEAQEQKRALMLQQRIQQGIGEDKLLVPINVNEPIVYLDPVLARRVKPHQIEGIRFMWREIIENPSGQGCLLAHTMGLGKTLQVIALLASIAQSNKSDDAKLRQHIPSHLQRCRVLILCPQSLVPNWYEELSNWLPDPMMLGVLIMMDSSVRQPEITIKNWFNNGGVMICSYERFRIYVLNTEAANIRQSALEDRIRHLTEGPDIVVADEAHKLTNMDSKINRAANMVHTKSRIALTGSPLSNHLEEYYTMIDWIAPGYLGNIGQFRERYIEAISRGLYSDSTDWERKNSMKRLHMFKKTIAPKISRADITVLAQDLPPKTEFFLTITLTKEQKEAYRIYINHLKGRFNQKVKGVAGRVWSWLNALSLLLNHPSCFIEKLNKQQEKEAQASAVNSLEAGSEDDGYDSAVAPPSADKDTVEQQPDFASAISKVNEVFAEAKAFLGMDDPSLSHKTVLVKLIVEEAVKLHEKTLIFSKSIPTLDYYETMIKGMGLEYKRIDGRQTTKGNDSGGRSRQQEVTEFNTSDKYKVFLISTKAGGLGLNIQAASRVIIGDFDFNPTWEEQAIGRAYRIGQKKPVFVYRFLIGGTFEELVHNKAVFKTQLFTRVVDKKNVIAQARVKPGEYLFEPREVEAKSFDDCLGKDPHILDRVLQKVDCVRNIFLTETFYQENKEELNEQELQDANATLEMERLERENPEEYRRRCIEQMRIQGRSAMQPSVNPQQATLSSSGRAPVAHYFTPVVPSQPDPAFTRVSSVQAPLYGLLPHHVTTGTAFGDEFVGWPARQNTQNPPQTKDDQAIPNILPSVAPLNTYAPNTLTYKGVSADSMYPRKSVGNSTPALAASASDTPMSGMEINVEHTPALSTDEAAAEVRHGDATGDTTDEEIEDEQSKNASGCRPQ